MAELPSGTATFLFTDIEGSTALLKQLGEGYGPVLADHQRLLREAVAAHGGHEIDTAGDGFFVAFRRAKDGVAAAARGTACPRCARVARRCATARAHGPALGRAGGRYGAAQGHRPPRAGRDARHRGPAR